MGTEYHLPNPEDPESYRSKMEDIISKRKSNSQRRNSHFELMVTFVLAEYKDPKFLLLFSLAHSLFVESIERQYIKMVEDDALPPFLQCVRISLETFDHDIHSLRPIYFESMKHHLGINRFIGTI